MRIDALILRLRPRTPLEAADLGARLCQRVSRSVYSCYFMVALPAAALSLASFAIAPWLPALLLACSKPWLDRTILFVLARAAFGQPTAPGDLWRAQREVWWRQLLYTLIVRRLSPWRSYTQPVYQLEGLSIRDARRRVRQLRRRRSNSALLMSIAFAVAEGALALALLSLVYWFAPTEHPISPMAFVDPESDSALALLPSVCYALAILFLEPFYVAAGFAMYLHRRAELEAWDIEQEFRRAFAA
jgi:hypothetical protein